ncbi:serine/threonine-protein phosphatase [candidate division KSB1 bacterium]|nr:serine/threonine-protein phosphatase [candidate division KSB1 bacterium]
MLTNAKEYYRKLDTFLSEIYQVGEGNVLSTILEEVVNDLGQDLRIKNGRLYELQDEKYVLVRTKNLDSIPENEKELSILDPAVSLLLCHGCYIYNDPEQQLNLQKDISGTLVGFSLQREEESWLFIFEVREGWEREEIEFSFNTIKKVLHARIASEYFTSSLNQAKLIQRSLLPKNAPKISGFDIFGKSISTEIVGGDMYDYMEFNDGHFGIAIGDASGHGLPAALLVRDVVTGLRMGLEKEMKITPVLEKLNRVIHRSTLSTSFTSLFYAEVETNGDIVYTNAGHPPPILVNGDDFELLERGGTILGPLPNVKLQRGFAYLKPGSFLILFSDGLIERQNLSGEHFEISRVIEIMIKNQKLTAQELVEHIIDAAYIFGNQSKWKDDLTVVVVKRVETNSN